MEQKLGSNSINPEETQENPIPVFSGNSKAAFDISLMLSSQNIAHWIDAGNGFRYHLYVDPDNRVLAREQIQLYWKENRGSQILHNPFGLSLAPIGILVPSMIIATIMPFFYSENYLKNVGKLISHKIQVGYFQLAITSLSLHANWEHLAGNILFGAVFLGVALQWTVQWGLLSLVLLMASACANIIMAMITRPEFSSIGFSTYVSAAIASAGVLSWKIQPQTGLTFLRSKLPLLGAWLLLMAVGTDPESNVLAHLLGFFCGLAATWWAMPLLTSKQQKWNWVAYGSYLIIHIMAWWKVLA